MTAAALGSSFRDPSGYVFRREGVVYRHVAASYATHYEVLIRSGLYEALVGRGLLIPHEEVEPAEIGEEGAYRILRPSVVPFVSYPYEWSYSQLRDAALATLEIQKLALASEMTLKDASAFNIQFVDGRPLLIDTLSFETRAAGAPWVGYRQFCQHFLAPLALMSRVDVRLGSLLQQHIDGIPLDLASELLPASSWFRFSTLLHVHLHAKSQRRFATTRVRDSALHGPISRPALLGLVDSLESAVRGMQWRAVGTEWADYTTSHNYGDAALAQKERLVREYLGAEPCGTVWDLGANTGRFSAVAAELGAHVVAIDGDPAAVDRHYRELRRSGAARILPLLANLVNPSPALGWAHEERMSLAERGPANCLLALALVHHLAISNNVPLDRIARLFARLAPRLIIEFVPKRDSQVQRLLANRADAFPEYTEEGFERAFRTAFRIRRTDPIGDSERRLYLMELR